MYYNSSSPMPTLFITLSQSYTPSTLHAARTITTDQDVAFWAARCRRLLVPPANSLLSYPSCSLVFFPSIHTLFPLNQLTRRSPPPSNSDYHHCTPSDGSYHPCQFSLSPILYFFLFLSFSFSCLLFLSQVSSHHWGCN